MSNLLRLIIVIVSIISTKTYANDFTLCDNHNEVCEFIYTFQGYIAHIIESTENKEDIRNKLERFVSEVIDINYISRFVMGVHWKQASEKQKIEFSTEYKKYITNVYINYLEKYSRYEFDILSIKKSSANNYYVSIRLVNSENDFLTLEFKVLQKEDLFYIQDLKMNSTISLIIYQRDKITSMIANEGLDVTISNISKDIIVIQRQ